MSQSIYAHSLFMDSGAYTLYNEHVLKSSEHGKKDYSYYNLRKGSEFRAYCNTYANTIRECKGLRVLFANVDAIRNPEVTWEVQNYFEQEHGLYPVPVVHPGTHLKWVDRYLEKGRYTLIGMGGFGHGMAMDSYMDWASGVFARICPASNGHKPLVRVHGFAMTSWKVICEFPWWSVDSATWVKLAAYGWLYVPRWSEKSGFRFDRPPMQVNASFRSPQKAKSYKHIEGMNARVPNAKKAIELWLERCGLEMGTVDGDGKMVDFGVSSDFQARSIANLHYFKDLEESRPAWPSPLHQSTILRSRNGSGVGLGLYSDREESMGGGLDVRKVRTPKPSKMRIYFSGSSGLVHVPEALIPERKPHIMLSYHYMKSKGTQKRLEEYLKRKRELCR